MQFLIGSQNFGLDMENSDKDYVQVNFPSVSDLCKEIPKTKEQKNDDDSIVKLIDIRSIPTLMYKSNLDMIQLLYSKEVTNGGEVESYFRQYEEELSTINIPRLYQSVMGSALNRYKRQTTKDLAHIIFGFKTLIQLEQQQFTDLRKCFEHQERAWYQTIRQGSYQEGLKVAQTLEQQALELKEVYMSVNPNELFKTKMEKDFGNMIVQHLSKEQ